MNLPANAGDAGSIPGPGRSPGGGNGNPLQYFLPGKFHGQRSLVGYSPRGHKESDTSEQLTHTHIQLGHAESSYTVPGKVNKGPVL